MFISSIVSLLVVVFSPNRAYDEGVLTGLLRGLERCARALVVHFDQEKPVLGDTCSRLA